MVRSVPAGNARIGKKIDFLAAELGETLKSHGFVRKGRSFWREKGEGFSRCFHLLDIQGDKWNEGASGRFCINIGTSFPALMQRYAELPTQDWRLKYVEEKDTSVGCLQVRLQDSLPEERQSWWVEEMDRNHDIWFRLDENTDIEALAAVLCRSANEYVLPWFDQFASLEGLFSGLGGGMPTYSEHGCRLIAGVLLGRKTEVATLFAEKGSRWFSQQFHGEVKNWLARQGVDMAAVEYLPPPENPLIQSRNDNFRAARGRAFATELSVAQDSAPLGQRLPQLLDAYLEASRSVVTRDAISPIERLLKDAALDVRRQVILLILRRLTQAPRTLPSAWEGVWGDVSFVHDYHWGELLTTLLKGYPCDEDFARELLVALTNLAGRYCRTAVVGIAYPYPFTKIVTYLNREARSWSEPLKPQVEVLLEAIRGTAVTDHDETMRTIRELAKSPDADESTKALATSDDSATRWHIDSYPEQCFDKPHREAIGVLRKWLRRDAEGRDTLDIEQDDWGQQLSEALPHFPGNGSALMDMIGWFAEEAAVHATKAFLARLERSLPELMPGNTREASCRWLETLLRGFANSDLTYEWATTGPRPGVGAFLGTASGNILMGLIHLVRILDAQRFAPALAVVAEAGFTVVPRIRMRSQKAATAAIEGLAGNEKGRELLAKMRTRFKKPAPLKIIDATLAR